VVITSRSSKEANREKVDFYFGVITENLIWINRYRASEYLKENNFRLKKGGETIGEKIEHLFWWAYCCWFDWRSTDRIQDHQLTAIWLNGQRSLRLSY